MTRRRYPKPATRQVSKPKAVRAGFTNYSVPADSAEMIRKARQKRLNKMP